VKKGRGCGVVGNCEEGDCVYKDGGKKGPLLLFVVRW